MPANHGHTHDGSSVAPLQALRQFVRERKPAQPPVEHCELCGEALASRHHHLLDLASHTIICACDACSILFNKDGAGGRKYCLVPRRIQALPDFHMTDDQWDDLMIPVNMVYIYHGTASESARAFYPSPAGAMESLLSLEYWEVLVSSNPILREMEPDVEALLINRTQDRQEYFIVPIDTCYQLVGAIRISWKGLSGGEDVWKAIAEFFTNLRETAVVGTSAHTKGEHDA